MYSLLRPFLFSMGPARAHSAAMLALGPVEHLSPFRAVFRAAYAHTDPRLEVRKMGLVFPSPLGLAGGFDKNADRARAMATLGFGHVELGTVTAEAQAPNPLPNLFRLPADSALINRLGFPNEGAEHVAARIAVRKSAIPVPVGVSIGKSRSVPLEPMSGVVADYLKSFRAVRDVADFVVVNVSSPNTKDLRAIQAADTARTLFQSLLEERDRAGTRVPLLVKIAPDLVDDAIDAICEVAKEVGLAGIVATNTTISRDGLATPQEEIERIGAGGLSGKPLFPRSLSVVKRVRTQVGPSMCVIGVGGIDGVETALAMLRAGADLVQVYTGFIYRGPSLPADIARGLLRRMESEGVSSLEGLVSGQRVATSS
ncbi:Dihydroorotate dehydrogenase [Labilithrix luteola]|uniref:Dihydroorotate dehydrogenase (quinone) n=1 Tax=Labilithrix luteola TaxID=1391654 RepID=A0A0K1PW44_9BACT|nr:quinone-dependent dihydroorotate dehydrogenase [Labilithrix luteola]AKU97621.1 Dihydroorotate dehydrogenase [Labilithrix luteola]